MTATLRIIKLFYVILLTLCYQNLLSYRKYFRVFSSILTEELLPMAYLLIAGLLVKVFQTPDFPAVLLSLKSQNFVFNLSIYIHLDAIRIQLIQKKELSEGS